MTVIRGATTIARDDAEEIKGAVKELLDQISSRNDLRKDEIVSLVFSSTSDIHSYYPATAARDAGYQSCSLFSAQEPDIEGGLKLCIRAMIFVEKNEQPRHVYLRGAKSLRKDLTQKFNVAIDGPAGSGKSTVGKAIAREFNILYLDTGAMYRACALKILEEGVDVNDEEGVVGVMSRVKLDIAYENGMQKTLLDGRDVSEAIREPRVSMAASAVSKLSSVRLKMTEKQREIAGKASCVLDGRDIGTVVLPEADFKFFFTASPYVRARRRYLEHLSQGHKVDFEKLLEEIRLRDEQDETRTLAPLKKADDAIEIDTSELSVGEVIAIVKSKIKEKI